MFLHFFFCELRGTQSEFPSVSCFSSCEIPVFFRFVVLRIPMNPSWTLPVFVGDSPAVLSVRWRFACSPQCSLAIRLDSARVRWRFTWSPQCSLAIRLVSSEFVGDSPGLRQCSLAIRLESTSVRWRFAWSPQSSLAIRLDSARVRWRFAWTPPVFVGDSPGVLSVSCVFFKKIWVYIVKRKPSAKREKTGGLKCYQCGCWAKSYRETKNGRP